MGVGGRVKLGHWTMIRVQVQAGQKEKLFLVAKTKDGDGTEVVHRFAVPSGGGELIRYIKWGRVESGLRLELVDSVGRVLDQQQARVPSPPLSSVERIILSAGKQAKLAGAISFADSADNWNGTHSEIDQLPDRWQGYDAVDTFVLTTSEPQTTKKFSPAQFTALERWVRLGGRFILIVGKNGQEVFGDSASRFRRFLPGDFKGVVDQVRTEKIETYAGAKSPLDRVVDSSQTFKFPVCLLANLRADVDLYETAGTESDRPLIARYSYGFGRVVLVAFDLNSDLFRRWESYDRLTYQVLSLVTRSGSEHLTRTGRVSHVGYDDVMGQLRGVLDQFTGVHTIAFSLVAILIIAYVMLIGPLDYFVLRRLGWQRITWVTLPVTTIVFCGIAVWLFVSSKSPNSQVNQVDLVDVDMTSGTIRGTSWSHIYSGQGDSYDLSLKVETPVNPSPPEIQLSWHGMPGTGLGGLGNPSFSPGGQSSYFLGALERSDISGLPIPVGGTKSIVGRWWSRRKFSVDQIKLKENRDGMLEGRLRWSLPIEFRQSILLYRNWAYYIRFPLKEGSDVLLRELPSPKHFDWRLTRRYTVDARNVTTPWDTGDLTDLPRIMEIMMFFKLAGGRNYTNLSHRYQAFVDMSDQLTSRQAILFGQAAERATVLNGNSRSSSDSINGKNYDQSWTFYRVIVPVQRR